MNKSPDDFDTELVAYFRQEHRYMPDDPFVGATALRVRAARRRGNLFKYVLCIASVLALVLVSQWLIEASVIASRYMDAWFSVGFDWFITPLGTGALLTGIACVAVMVGRQRSH